MSARKVPSLRHHKARGLAVARNRWVESHLRRRAGVPRMLMAMVTALATLSGCGPAGTIVSGVVTLHGRPLDDAIIRFFPVAGDGQTSHTFTDFALTSDAK